MEETSSSRSHADEPPPARRRQDVAQNVEVQDCLEARSQPSRVPAALGQPQHLPELSPPQTGSTPALRWPRPVVAHRFVPLASRNTPDSLVSRHLAHSARGSGEAPGHDRQEFCGNRPSCLAGTVNPHPDAVWAAASRPSFSCGCLCLCRGSIASATSGCDASPVSVSHCSISRANGTPCPTSMERGPCVRM